jgi:hypothetical protein
LSREGEEILERNLRRTGKVRLPPHKISHTRGQPAKAAEILRQKYLSPNDIIEKLDKTEHGSEHIAVLKRPFRKQRIGPAQTTRTFIAVVSSINIYFHVGV